MVKKDNVMVRMNISVDRLTKEYLDAHPEINVSYLVRAIVSALNYSGHSANMPTGFNPPDKVYRNKKGGN